MERKKKAWNLANKYRVKYENGRIDVNSIIELIKGRGYWSIWFTVFKGIDEVRERMIIDFPGTSATCFDPNNHYEPIERNPGCEDPV